MVVKTFRGLLADGGQDRIRLQTIKGKVGYKVIKFELFGNTPGATEYEHVVKIYKTSQSSIDGVVNFTDSDLLAASYLEGYIHAYYTDAVVTIFDNEIFNQDVFVTQKDVTAGGLSCNYYLELEVIPLDDAGAEYTTLKDMRST